ncbi:hypothetical protein RchiOBHm_Chr6g0303081 [Rosa chinensis]|uniref:Uncharacterized protein n=1 Tax=Rosa chinensis TaxID=74649 RepID=A0A2P6PZ59_ROSCH|nr:hypothetical protein RchiOBHm_Chr6g0303081 [Rosa chinensis]
MTCSQGGRESHYSVSLTIYFLIYIYIYIYRSNPERSSALKLTCEVRVFSHFSFAYPHLNRSVFRYYCIDHLCKFSAKLMIIKASNSFKPIE